MEHENELSEVLKCGVRLSYVLARTMFLQRIPMAESSRFACSMRLQMNSSALLQNLCSGFPKLHEMMKNQKAPKSSPDFQHLLHKEMGIADILPHIQREVRIMIGDEVALRSGFNSAFTNTVVIEDLMECAETIQLLERKVQILDAIHPLEIKAGDFLAIWSGNEELVVPIQVSEEWDKMMKEGLDSNKAAQEQSILCNSNAELNRLKVSLLPSNIEKLKDKEVKAVKSRIKKLKEELLKLGTRRQEAEEKNLLKWVVEKQSDQFSAFWWFFNTDLRVAVQFGSQASVLLKHFLDNLPAGQQSAMKIEQLKVSLQMFAQDEGNVAAKKILELKLSRFSTIHQNITGACEADNGTVNQFKKLFIALDMIFRHPICFKKGQYKVRDSLDIYVKQCHGLLQELAEKLKLQLKMPQEYCDSEEEELRDIIKSWRKLSPKWDLVFGKKEQK
ncbi:hypothetical protein M0R45_014350 [Rubus argutus]|uniref:Uncharacterized protein n=1 Tax=Rubus argutus TaxID=59490 RepID=A0AAW1XMN0_RUBAR